MSNDKKNKGRFKYFQDYPFEDVPKKNGKGTKRKRVYRGSYFGYVIPKEYKKDPRSFVSRIKLFYGAITLGMLILWLMGCFINPAGQHELYVVVPYAILALVIALITFTIGEFILFTPDMRYTRDFADLISSALRTKTIIAMITAAISTVSELTFIILKWNSLDNNVTEIGYCILTAGITGLCYFYLKLQDSLKLEVKAN